MNPNQGKSPAILIWNIYNGKKEKTAQCGCGYDRLPAESDLVY